MYLTRSDMIEKVKEAFLDDEYKSAINKRLVLGFSIDSLNSSDCRVLNWIVDDLESPMLIYVVFSASMSSDLFDTYISRLLYVSGKWVELCFYQMLISHEFKECKIEINFDNGKETVVAVYFAFDFISVIMGVDDQKTSIRITTDSIQEKEF